MMTTKTDIYDKEQGDSLALKFLDLSVEYIELLDFNKKYNVKLFNETELKSFEMIAGTLKKIGFDIIGKVFYDEILDKVDDIYDLAKETESYLDLRKSNVKIKKDWFDQDQLEILNTKCKESEQKLVSVLTSDINEKELQKLLQKIYN